MAKQKGKARRRLTDGEILAQLPGARKRGRLAKVRGEPRARSARYDADSGLVIVQLTNGALVGFPALLGPGLEGATAEQLARVEVSPAGEGLHWETLDADISLPGILERLFGTKAAMRALGRRGGTVRSRAKSEAARTNGAKGGRPRKRAAG